MGINFQHRAHVALQSLDSRDQTATHKALSWLTSVPHEQMVRSPRIKKVQGLDLYILKIGIRLRAVLSRKDDVWTVEDIVDHDRLQRLLSVYGGV